MAGKAVFIFVFILLAVSFKAVAAQKGARIDFPLPLAGYKLQNKYNGGDACGLYNFNYTLAELTPGAKPAALTVVPGEYANITLAIFSPEGDGPYMISISPSGVPENLVKVDTIVNAPGDKSPVGPVPAGISYPFSFNVVFRVPENATCPATGCLVAVANDFGTVSCTRVSVAAGAKSAYPLKAGFFKNKVPSANSPQVIPEVLSSWNPLVITTQPHPVTKPVVPVSDLQVKLRARFEKLLKIFKQLKVDTTILFKRTDVLRNVASLLLQI